MACNCTKNRQSVKFVYTAPDGRQTTYSTEVEAKAAKIRGGGGYEVKPA